MDHGLLIGQYENADNGLDVVSLERDYLDGRQVDLICLSWNRGLEVPPDSWRGPSWSGRFGSGTDTEQKQNDMQRTFGGTGRRYAQSYPIGNPTDQRDYQPAAAGQYNDAFRSFAQDLVSMGMQDSILRLSPEHNQDWGPRSCQRDPAAYADAFAQCVRTMIDVPGQDFTFLISPAGHSLNHLPASWPTQSSYWPSGQPPPVVTPSTYDNARLYLDYTESEYNALSDAEKKQVSDQAWAEQQKPELDMWRDFADSKGAQMALIEWGVHLKAMPEAWGDDPWYMNRIFDYAEQHGFLFEHYWNAWVNNPTYPTSSLIWPPVKPLDKTRAAWKANVLADDSGTPPPPPRMIGNYTLPQTGDTGWDVELNNLFAQIEADVQALGTRYGVSVQGSYQKPAKGTLDWDVPVVQNIQDIEADVQELAAAAGVSGVGGYSTPSAGSSDWDVALNNDFTAIGADLQSIDAGPSNGGGGGGGGGGGSNLTVVSDLSRFPSGWTNNGLTTTSLSGSPLSPPLSGQVVMAPPDGADKAAWDTSNHQPVARGEGLIAPIATSAATEHSFRQRIRFAVEDGSNYYDLSINWVNGNFRADKYDGTTYERLSGSFFQLSSPPTPNQWYYPVISRFSDGTFGVEVLDGPWETGSTVGSHTFGPDVAPTHNGVGIGMQAWNNDTDTLYWGGFQKVTL